MAFGLLVRNPGFVATQHYFQGSLMRVASLVKAGMFATLLVGSATAARAQGKVVVAHDEWFTQSGFFGASEQQFMSNVTNFFGLAASGSILLYSDDNFLTNAPFVAWLEGKGFTVTTSAGATNFTAYSAVFVEGNTNLASTASSLAAYVMGGGNVLDIGGTGVGGSAAEAAYNNGFLGAFGFAFADSYNGLGTVNTSGYAGQGPFGAALFTGVSSVFANNGNDVLTATSVAGITSQTFVDANGNGTFGAAQVTATPEPGSIALLSTGLMGLVPAIKRRRRR